MIYLDNAATSKRKPLWVQGRFLAESLRHSVNAGRGGYGYSLDAVRKIITAQEKLARLFNIPDPQQICFTYNATYALNLAIGGLLKDRENPETVVSQMEHNSVLRPAYLSSRPRIIPADAEGFVKMDRAGELFRGKPVFAACTHASNVCGSIQDVKTLCRLAHDHGTPFILDASQTAGCLPLDAQDIDADIIVFSGHKGLMGPLGTGVLYMKKEIKIPPYIVGGTGSMSQSLSQPEVMPDRFHSGTLNTPAITALGEAADFVYYEGVAAIAQREKELAEYLAEDLSSISGVRVLGPAPGRSRNGTVAFLIEGVDVSLAGELLEREHHIAIRSGYHCAPLAHRALGTERTGCLRASFGFFDTAAKEKKLAKAVAHLAKQAGCV